MVAAGIGTIVTAGVAAVFIFAIEQFTVLVEQNAAEESLLWASYNTRSFFSQAIDLEVATTVDNSIPAGSKGQIRSSFTSGSNGVITTIAAFAREMSTGGTVAPTSGAGSNLVSTGVFLINPSSTAIGNNGQPWGGILIFTTAPTGTAMWPTLNGLWFDRISEFKLQDVECSDPGSSGASCVGKSAKSATFIIKARYFKNAKRNQWFYQPTPVAANTSPYRDIEMTIKVGFRDNVLLKGGAESRVGSSADERLHGGLYFFRMVLPPLRM